MGQPSIPEMESVKFKHSHYQILSIGLFISHGFYMSKRFQQSVIVLNSLEYEKSPDLSSSICLSVSHDFGGSVITDQSLIFLPSELNYIPSVYYDNTFQQLYSVVSGVSVTLVLTHNFDGSIGNFADSFSYFSVFVLTTCEWRPSNRIMTKFFPNSGISDGSHNSLFSQPLNSSIVHDHSVYFIFSLKNSMATVDSSASEKFLQFTSAALHHLTISQPGLSGSTNVSTVGLAGIGFAILVVLVFVIASLCFFIVKHRREERKEEVEEDMDVDVDTDTEHYL
jgi:Na+-transporting methylmalonyl-CoA/oxaloacetate decarboxylase gamma subunit